MKLVHRTCIFCSDIDEEFLFVDECKCLTIVGFKDRARLGPISFIFMKFSAKIVPNNRFYLLI